MEGSNDTVMGPVVDAVFDTEGVVVNTRVKVLEAEPSDTESVEVSEIVDVDVWEGLLDADVEIVMVVVELSVDDGLLDVEGDAESEEVGVLLGDTVCVGESV